MAIYHGNRRQQHGQWRWQRGWRESNGGNNGDGEGGSMKDMASCAMTGERVMMVAMGHGLYVCVFVC